MQPEGPQTPYEVYCNRCRVSFAAGTRRCVHCGSRLDPTRGQPRLLMPPTLERHPDFEDEDVLPHRSRISPISILWIVAAVAVGIQRACAT
jgi:hypothetical protein